MNVDQTDASRWAIYRGDGQVRRPRIPPPPPWRRFAEDAEPAPPPDPADEEAGATFQAHPDVVSAVNAALRLRRPLLLTGDPGSGKSSLIDAVARELDLGKVLRWHVTSRSALTQALYRYDAIGRMQAEQFQPGTAIGEFLSLGPLGTALVPRTRPRALLVDEIDKSDIDLPNDLLNVFERGEFDIPELSRHKDHTIEVREFESDTVVPIIKGHVRCREFPFVVLTSNGERDFPAAFLRRCIRLRMPELTDTLLRSIVAAHLGDKEAEAAEQLIRDFVNAPRHERRATDQLLNAAYLVTQRVLPGNEGERERVMSMLLKELVSDN